MKVKSVVNRWVRAAGLSRAAPASSGEMNRLSVPLASGETVRLELPLRLSGAEKSRLLQLLDLLIAEEG